MATAEGPDSIIQPTEHDLRGVALACSQINGSMQILSEIAEDTGDERCWALMGSLDSALAAIEPLREQA